MYVNVSRFFRQASHFKNGLLVLAFSLLTASMSWANTYTVSNTDDDGAGSLRQALSDANANPGVDEIHFSVAGTLVLLSNLPNITDPLTIDGTTAPGYVAGTPSFVIETSFDGFFALEPITLTIKGLALQQSGGLAGNGFQIFAPTGVVSIQNCKVTSFETAIKCSGDADWTLTDNDLTISGRALSFVEVNTGTITASGNLFGSVDVAYYAIQFENCSNKVIGDEHASPAADILIRDSDGLKNARQAIRAEYCSNLTFDNLDLNFPTSGLGSYGLALLTSSGNMVVKNCGLRNRGSLICNGNANWTVTHNDLAMSAPAIRFTDVTTGTISASENIFGGGTYGGEALVLTNCSDKIIGDENASPAADILIKDTDGLTSLFYGGISTVNCSNLTFDNLDLSYSGAFQEGAGLYTLFSSGTMTVRNCKVSNRTSAIYCDGDANWTVVNNDVRTSHTGLSFYQVPTGAITAFDNLFGGANASDGLVLFNCANHIIGDENASPAANILIKDTDGLSSVLGSAIGATFCSNLTFDNLDLNHPYFTNTTSGIFTYGSSGNMAIKNCQTQNRFSGIACNGDANWTVTNNNVTNCYTALVFGNVPNGTITASDNLFGGPDTGYGLFMFDCGNKIIGDENASPAADILIKDTDGLVNVQEFAAHVTGCSNLTFDNLDLSKASGAAFGTGLNLLNATGKMTVKKCTLNNRSIGLNLSGNTANSLISCNVVTNCATGIATDGTHTGHSIVNNTFLNNGNSIQQSGTPLVARFNYWGGGAPVNGGANGYTGSVNVSNHLTSPPDCSSNGCTDSDSDGICDADDNCPNTANPAQTDSDCDGVGNACDVCPNSDDTIDNNNDNIPDCSQELPLDDYSPLWKCSRKRILICHNGLILCINHHALAGHLSHGDQVGPCISCPTQPSELLDRSSDDSSELEADELEIFPNPASDEVNIYLHHHLGTNAVLSVTDQLGKTVWATPLAENQALVTLSLSDSRFASGVYFVALQTDNQIITRRLIVTK